MKTDANRGRVYVLNPMSGRGQRADRIADDLYRQARDRQDLLGRFYARGHAAVPAQGPEPWWRRLLRRLA